MDPLKEYVRNKIILGLASSRAKDDIFESVENSMKTLVEENKIESYLISRNNVENRIKSVSFNSTKGWRYTINIDNLDKEEIRKAKRYYKIKTIIK